jgi:hypothetical protein
MITVATEILAVYTIKCSLKWMALARYQQSKGSERPLITSKTRAQGSKAAA